MVHKLRSVSNVGEEENIERKVYNVHKKKATTKCTKAREKEHLKFLNVFVVIGYSYRKIITY